MKIGWVDMCPENALEMGLNQAARIIWQMWIIEIFGCGIALRVRPKP